MTAEPRSTPVSTGSTRPLTLFRASDHVSDSFPHLLLAVSGSVATIKLPLMLQALSKHNISIRVVLTPSASRFLQSQSAEQPSFESYTSIPHVDGIYEDSDEWEFGTNGVQRGWKRGDPILHIELRKWADLMVIAPLSANMMAKIVGGMAEGLLNSIVRAWDTNGSVDVPRNLVAQSGGGSQCILNQKKRIIVAAAMNTAMWRQPITERHIKVLEEDWGVGHTSPVFGEGWFEVLRPKEKSLACGDVGEGGMKEWNEIVQIIEQRLGLGE
jgi:phosphopantothenoylcysteine decarboxylase